MLGMSARRRTSDEGRDEPELADRALGAQAQAPTEAFDARLARLEALVVELEGGQLGLEAAIDRYREGVALLRGCRETLGEFQRQVEELAADGTRPFPGDPDVRPGGAPSGGAGGGGR